LIKSKKNTPVNLSKGCDCFMNKGNFAILGFGFGSMPDYKPIAAILTLPLNSQKTVLERVQKNHF